VVERDPITAQAEIPGAAACVPAVEGIRFDELWYTFAALQLSAGVQFVQVSKSLGHSCLDSRHLLGVDPEEDSGTSKTCRNRPAR
jgi:integrase